VSAETACAWGLVHQVVDDDELERVTQTTTARVADSAPLALAATKRLLRLSRTASSEDEFFSSEADTQALLRATADHAEAVAAFAEHRRPRFLGR
jgi:2-(1,2-epoxy-1,2-dihydrophenyl)acetyl-CoA isomerase